MSVAGALRPRAKLSIVLGLLLAPIGTAQAATIISASATAFQASFQLASGGSATLAPSGVASGTAPPALAAGTSASSYSRRLDIGPVFTGPLYASLGASTLTSSAQGTPTTGSASASLAYAGFGVLVAQTVTRDSYLAGMSARALGSSTVFDGTNLIGSTSFDELYVNRDNFDNVFYSNGATSIAPNSIVWDQDGYRIVLNEQIFTDETVGGADVRTLTTNAFHVTFTNYPAIGDLSGDLIAGQSRVSVSTTADVPEPATWAMMVAGFGLVGAALRRRVRSAPAGTSAR